MLLLLQIWNMVICVKSCAWNGKQMYYTFDNKLVSRIFDLILFFYSTPDGCSVVQLNKYGIIFKEKICTQNHQLWRRIVSYGRRIYSFTNFEYCKDGGSCLKSKRGPTKYCWKNVTVSILFFFFKFLINFILLILQITFNISNLY